MRLFLLFLRTYPYRTAGTLGCLLLAGLAEGIGLGSLLPLIGLAAGRSAPGVGPDASGFEMALTQGFRAVGLEPTIDVLLATIVVAMSLKSAVVLAANRQIGYAVAQVATDLRLSLIRAVLRSRWEYYVHKPVGAFANAVTLEARRASETYLEATTILALLVQATVSASVAVLISWRTAAVAFAAAAVITFALNRLVRMSRKAGARQTKLSKSLSVRLTDTLQTVKPLKAMAREGLIGPLLEKETEKLNRALRRDVLSREAMKALQEPLIVAFLCLGAWVAMARSHLPVATVITLGLLCARIVTSLGKVQKEIQKMAGAESAFWSLRRMIAEAEAAEDVKPGTRPPDLRRGISFSDVGFAYDDQPVLQGVSMTIPAGEVTVMVGTSGSGKTTVADLVIGLLEARQGIVSVDGVPIGDLDAHAWRSRIGYVPQETLLLHETIRTNVTLGDPSLSEADVVDALRAAGAWDFVASLPEGVDGSVGERGLRVSGGQRQRIALARALVRRPTLLVLDEATSGLDPKTEAEICSTLTSLRGRVTILAISHHGALADVADRLYRVEQGRVTLVRGGAAAGR